MFRISIHALREEGDPLVFDFDGEFVISIHALREEGDALKLWSDEAAELFLSTPSARRATSQLCRPAPADRISIHALREEGDPVIPLKLCGLVEISIHALREEGDAFIDGVEVMDDVFLSTPSARRATVVGQGRDLDDGFLSTPSARRATCGLGSALVK